MPTNKHTASDKALIEAADALQNEETAEVKDDSDTEQTQVPEPQQPESVTEEYRIEPNMLPVNLSTEGSGNHNPDAAHEMKASTLEKHRVDQILDEEEARRLAKHTKH
ncbi:MAG: hypothetical protein LH606_22335 [Cytophagaceae bacterium]|nr:hypothetical protein [Cytophagaceae bacterium]